MVTSKRLILVIVLQGAVLAYAQSPDAATLCHEGQTALKAGQTDRAIELLSQAVARRPGETVYGLRLAEAYLAAGRSHDAESVLRIIRNQDPRSHAATITLGRLYAARADWRLAVELLSPCEKRLDSDDVRLLAEALANCGRPGERAVLLERAVCRFPKDPAIAELWIRDALEKGCYATALERITKVGDEQSWSPPLHYFAAQAYFGLGQLLGGTQVRAIPQGKIGRFDGNWLPVIESPGEDRFVCAPRESAINHLRRALDGGFDAPGAHVLHARIWKGARQPDTGFAILRSRAAVLLAEPTDDVLSAFAELALAANDLDDFLEYASQRAALNAELRDEILYAAYLAAAEEYSLCGDEQMYIELLSRALAIRAADTSLMLRLADAEWDASQRVSAARHYRELLNRQPMHPRRELLLERIAEALSTAAAP